MKVSTPSMSVAGTSRGLPEPLRLKLPQVFRGTERAEVADAAISASQEAGEALAAAPCICTILPELLWVWYKLYIRSCRIPIINRNMAVSIDGGGAFCGCPYNKTDFLGSILGLVVFGDSRVQTVELHYIWVLWALSVWHI